MKPQTGKLRLINKELYLHKFPKTNRDLFEKYFDKNLCVVIDNLTIDGTGGEIGSDVVITKSEWRCFESFIEEDTSNHHQHHDLIIAWAKGAKIQSKTNGGYWLDCNPHWYEEVNYRVKVEVDNSEAMEQCQKEMTALAERLAKLKEEHNV